jgi:hypothetical protein
MMTKDSRACPNEVRSTTNRRVGLRRRKRGKIIEGVLFAIRHEFKDGPGQGGLRGLPRAMQKQDRGILHRSVERNFQFSPYHG